MDRLQRIREIDEQLKAIDETEEYYKDMLRKMDYPDGSFIESLWNAVSRATGMRGGMRAGASMGLDRCEQERSELKAERARLGW